MPVIDCVSSCLLAAAPSWPLDAPTMAALEQTLGRLHPLVVHFPIALLIIAAAAELLTGVFTNRRRSRVGVPCAIVGGLGAVAAAWFGWLFAAHDPVVTSTGNLLLLHRWIGVAAAAFAGGAAVLAMVEVAGPRDWARNGYRGALIISAVLVGFSGHYGGEMVYGEGYLLEAWRSPDDRRGPAPPLRLAVEEPVADPVTAPPGAITSEPVVSTVSFTNQIRPILEDRCVRCHGPRRQRGDLRLDDVAALLAKASQTPIIAPRNAAGSELYRRVSLPADDPDHMPAAGDPLTPEQIALIRTWIEDGAIVDEPAPIASAESGTVPAARAPQASSPAAHSPRERGLVLRITDESERVRRDQAMRRIIERGGVALVLATNTDAVQVDLSRVDPPASDDDLALLDGLESSLVWLDLSRSQVSGAGLARLRGFKALRRLLLAHAPIDDEAIAQAALPSTIESINLVGTSVSDDGLEALASLPNLRNLYLWSTKVSADGVASLQARRPGLEIVSGLAHLIEVAAEETPPPAPLPTCCAQARAAGGTCDHPCCVAAAKDGAICSTCPTTPAAGES